MQHENRPNRKVCRIGNEAAPMKPNGHSWRFLAWVDDDELALDSRDHPGAVFDELVVDDWLHVEQMDRELWWMRIGDLVVWVRSGAVVSVERDS
jgi:hypothetical protein